MNVDARTFGEQFWSLFESEDIDAATCRFAVLRALIHAAEGLAELDCFLQEAYRCFEATGDNSQSQNRPHDVGTIVEAILLGCRAYEHGSTEIEGTNLLVLKTMLSVGRKATGGNACVDELSDALDHRQDEAVASA